MQKIEGYVNTIVINLYARERTIKLLQTHYNDILSILNKLDSFVPKIYLSKEMRHNKEGDHNCSMLGDDAIVRRKMPTWSDELVHLSSFLFQNPHTEAFQN